MALLDEDGRKVLLGIGIGLASAAVLKGLLPAFSGLGRPLAKATIKSGLAAFDRGREVWAHLAEVVEDLTAEARAELEQSRLASGVQTPPPPAGGEGGGGI
ncbi:MAG: DUF5132 domain-containing protein [Bryobacteraceae bacterium]|nr:DUF5132 domain-containing protein [Bryobacteraceae bacterium]